MLAGPCNAAAILTCPSATPKPNCRPLKEFLMLFRNFPSPICTTSYTCLIRAGSFTSSRNSASFHSEAFHTSWLSLMGGAALNKPSVVKYAAARDSNDLRVMLFMSIAPKHQLRPPIARLLEEDLRHHSFVLVIE